VLTEKEGGRWSTGLKAKGGVVMGTKFGQTATFRNPVFRIPKWNSKVGDFDSFPLREQIARTGPHPDPRCETVRPIKIWHPPACMRL